MQDERPPQERIPNIRTKYGSMNAKPITNRRTMVRNLQKTGSRPLSLHDDAEILDSPEDLILYLLQVSGLE